MCLSRWMFTCLQREYISICALFCWGGRGWAEGRLPVGPLCVGGLKFTRQKVTEKQKLSFCLLSIFFGSPQKMLELQPHTLRLPYPVKRIQLLYSQVFRSKMFPFLHAGFSQSSKCSSTISWSGRGTILQALFSSSHPQVLNVQRSTAIVNLKYWWNIYCWYIWRPAEKHQYCKGTPSVFTVLEIRNIRGGVTIDMERQQHSKQWVRRSCQKKRGLHQVLENWWRPATLAQGRTCFLLPYSLSYVRALQNTFLCKNTVWSFKKKSPWRVFGKMSMEFFLPPSS